MLSILIIHIGVIFVINFIIFPLLRWPC